MPQLSLMFNSPTAERAFHQTVRRAGIPLWVMVCGLTGTCAGPQPLHVAIRPADQDNYVERLNRENFNGRLAWLKWRAEENGTTLHDAERTDLAMSPTKNPFDAHTEPHSVSLGAVIYKLHCARCHGNDADGHGSALLPGHPAKDFHAPMPRIASTLYRGRPQKWFRIILDGTGDIVQYPDEPPGPAMPAFREKLAREQAWLAITYLQSLDIHARKRSE